MTMYLCPIGWQRTRKSFFPVIINMDGFILSHVIEPIELIEQEKIDQFLPPYQPLHRLDPDHPVTMGAFALPSIFAEAKKAQEEALLSSMSKIQRPGRPSET